jgi:hypothetical protein
MKRSSRNILVFFGLLLGSLILTVLWGRNPEKFPEFPAPLAIWLATHSNLPKEDLSILVGLLFSFLFLSLVTGIGWLVFKQVRKH